MNTILSILFILPIIIGIFWGSDIVHRESDGRATATDEIKVFFGIAIISFIILFILILISSIVLSGEKKENIQWLIFIIICFINLFVAKGIIVYDSGVIIRKRNDINRVKTNSNTSSRTQKTVFSSQSTKINMKIQEKEKNHKKYIKKITKELRDIEKRIFDISSELDISFPVNYMNELMFTIENINPEDTKLIQDIVNRITKQANDDLDNLIKSNALYLKVSDLIKNARSKMIKIREREILIEIHECFTDLNSDSLKIYLEKKKWMDYNSYLNDIINYINDMLKSVSDAQSKQNSMNNEMTGERAYKILGIKNNSSSEEIRKAYLQKIKEYHPDKVASLGDELKDVANKKTQEINEAYDYLMNIKNMI